MKPDDIPQGVWDAARKVDDECDRNPDWGWKPTEIIARAIMAEREACAAIADEYVKRDGNDAWARGYRSAGAGISQDIRSRP